MTQIPLLVALHLVGVVIALGFGPRRSPALCVALGFAVGLATVVLAAITLLAVGLPYRAWSVTLLLAPALVAAGVAIRRRGLPRSTRALAGTWTLVFVGVAALFSAFNLSRTTYDSHQFVMLGRVIGADGTLMPGTLSLLQSWGVFQALAHSLTAFTLQDFLYALQPVFGIAFVPVFALGLWAGADALGVARRHRTGLVVLVTAALVTIYMFQHHMFYIHTNFASAAYLFAFVALFWLAEVQADPSGLPIAFLCLLAFTLQRIEAPAVTLVALAVTVLPSALPRRSLGPLIAGLTLAVAGWFELLARHAPADGDFLTPNLCRAIEAALIGFLLFWLATSNEHVQRLARRVPLLLVVGTLLAVTASFALRPDHLGASLSAWVRNLVELPHWGQTWFILCVLTALMTLLEPPPTSRMFPLTVGLTLGCILLLAMIRVPYRFYVGDSANRMTIHVLPLLFYYFGLKLLPILGGPAKLTAPALLTKVDG